MPAVVHSTGLLEQGRVRAVRAPEAGVVSTVFVSPGDTVTVGAPVAQIDTTELHAVIDGLRGQLEASEAQVQQSVASAPIGRRIQEERVAWSQAQLLAARAALLDRMVGHDLGTDIDSLLAAYRPGQHIAIDGAVSGVRSAEAWHRLELTQVAGSDLAAYDVVRARSLRASLRSQIAALQNRLSLFTLRAPVDGIVVTEELDRLLGAPLPQGGIFAELAELGGWQVRLRIPDRDMRRLHVGDSVVITADDSPVRDRQQMVGVLGYLGKAPSLFGSTSTGPRFEAIVRLSTSEADRWPLGGLRHGLSVRAEVVTKKDRLIWVFLESLGE